MKIGGIQKISLLDYPEKISAIVWTVGCNFYCPFCYNINLVFEKTDLILEEEILKFLEKRKGVLEGLVISGGEPLLQKDIFDFCRKVKKIGYKIKIDTNGTKPKELQKLIDEKLVDYISMDVKAPKNKYATLTGEKVILKNIEKSIGLIKNSNIEYEFKTTFVPKLLSKDDIIEIGKWLKGSKRYYLQQFKNDVPVISDEIDGLLPYSKEELIDTIEKVKPFYQYCNVRGI
jgi:pyruvate formate lyase activating enzyme